MYTICTVLLPCLNIVLDVLEQIKNLDRFLACTAAKSESIALLYQYKYSLNIVTD